MRSRQGKWLVFTILVGWAISTATSAVWADPNADKESKPQVAQQKNPLAAPSDVAAPPADAIRTASGLAYQVLKKGDGKVHPTVTDHVTVNYTGWQTNGRMFDSSYKRGQPATFPLNRVIKGWTEGVQLMVVGEKARFWIPADLAYGDNPHGGRPTGMLVFDIELLKID